MPLLPLPPFVAASASPDVASATAGAAGAVAGIVGLVERTTFWKGLGLAPKLAKGLAAAAAGAAGVAAVVGGDEDTAEGLDRAFTILF